jgi:hypothetical protein
MAESKLKSSARARQLVASLLVTTQTPFKDYLKATDYCSAVMSYTDLREDREYLAQWRAAFAALMVAEDGARAHLLSRLREDFKRGRSPLPSLVPERH